MSLLTFVDSYFLFVYVMYMFLSASSAGEGWELGNV